MEYRGVRLSLRRSASKRLDEGWPRPALRTTMRRVRVEVQVVELRELAVDLAHQLVAGFPGVRLGAVLDQVAAADAIVAVSPVFNASYSGLFKLLVDALPLGSLDGVPVLLGATGGSARHSLVIEHGLRPLFAYLRATTTSTSVFAATEDWGSPVELDTRIARAGRELAVLVRGASAPAAVDPYDPTTSSSARFSESWSA